jgi:hypothetical protein
VLSGERPVSGARPSTLAVFILAIGAVAASRVPTSSFDHSYQAYAALLTSTIRGARVDYGRLVSRKRDLDLVAEQFRVPAENTERGWHRPERMAFWINAYNVFTLKAIADRYPIRARLFTLQPRNSIRQIEGVWTDLRFNVASRQLTLDDIEHRILRPEFKDARVHFALNCASVSCPPLREEPYVASRLDAQMDDAARRYLASPLGLQLTGGTLSVSSIFKWYGDDFIAAFAGPAEGERAAKERAIRGVIATYGPAAAQQVARSPDARVRFLRYDWSLNDSAR